MRTFALGIGECGRRLSLELYRTTNNRRLCTINRMHIFSLIDLTEIDSQMTELERMGIEKSNVNVFSPTDEEFAADPQFNLFIGKMKPIMEERGVGGLWFQSKEIAEDAFDTFYNMFQYYLEGIECYNVFHSAGGGTGCGAGPVFLDRIYKGVRKEKETLLSENLYTTTMVLPFKQEESWREANSAAVIGRYYKIGHAIILGDNEQGKMLIQNADSRGEFIETRDPQELINRRLAETWIAVQMTTMGYNFPKPKTFEAADLRNYFMLQNSASLLVPCHREYGLTGFLNHLTLEDAVYDTLKNHQLAAFEMDNLELLVIVAFPATVTDLASKPMAEMTSIWELSEKFRIVYRENTGESLNNVSAISVHSDSLIDSIKITVLARNPYLPRFLLLYERLKELAEDKTKMKSAIERMFPRQFDKELKDVITERAQTEFSEAYTNFEEYMTTQKLENKES